MIRKSALLFLIQFIVQSTYAQVTDSVRRTQLPAHLAPITRAPGSTILGSVYLYKGRKLNSPFSIEIPLQELDDPVASRHFRQFRTWTTLGRLTGLASVAYVLFNRTPDRQVARTIYISSLVASVGFTLLSNHQTNMAVRRYNSVIGTPRIGFGTTPVLSGRSVAGLSVIILMPYRLY